MDDPKAEILSSLKRLVAGGAKIVRPHIDPLPESLKNWALVTGLHNGKANLIDVIAAQIAFAGLLQELADTLRSDHKLRGLRDHSFKDFLSISELKAFLVTNSKQVECLSSANADILGELYENITPQAERRTLGQYWTPDPVTQLMSSWIGPTQSVLDPAAGSGRLLFPFIDQPCRITGVEISPLVEALAEVNLMLRSSSDLELLPDDFLRLKPSDEKRFEAVICNPPYTRHHHLSPYIKSTLKTELEQVFGIKMSGFSSLFVYFFLHAFRFLTADGRLAFITPSELYEASYSTAFKTFIQKHCHVDAIVTYHTSMQAFTGVDTAGCITLARPKAAEHALSRETQFIEVSSWPDNSELLRAVSGELPSGVYQWGKIRARSLTEVSPKEKWTGFVNHEENDGPNYPQLRSVAKVVRGIATGANDFFTLTDEELENLHIPKEYVLPIVTKTREVRSFVLDNASFDIIGKNAKKRWLLNYTGRLEDAPPSIAEYLKRGEELGLPKRSLISKKRLWYVQEKRDTPPILFTYLSRGKTRFIYNEAGAQALNVFLLIYPDAEIAHSPRLTKALTVLLNSEGLRQGLRKAGRGYGGDTVKLEPRELDSIPVIDPRWLSDKQIDELLDRFADDDDELISVNAYVLELIQAIEPLSIKEADEPQNQQGTLFETIAV